jgi:Glycosyltransferase family 87
MPTEQASAPTDTTLSWPEKVFGMLCGERRPLQQGVNSVLLRVLIFSIVTLATLVVVVQALRAVGKTNDFDVYYEAATAVVGGDSPYEFLGRLRRTYVYPPFFASILAPLAFLPRDLAGLIWSVLNLSCLVGSLRLLRRFLSFHRQPLLITAVSFLLIYPFVVNTVRTGQVGLILLFLMLMAGVSCLDGRTLRAPIALATAVSIKLVPALIALGWLIERRWRLVGWTVAWILVLSLLVPVIAMGPAGAMDAIGQYGEVFLVGSLADGSVPVWFGYRGYNSQSLLSAVYRWTSDPATLEDHAGGVPLHLVTLDDGARWFLVLLLHLSFLGAGLWAYVVVGKMAHSRQEAGLYYLALLLGLLPILSPVSLKNSFVFLLPVHAAVLVNLLGAGRSLRAVKLLFGVAFLSHLFPFGAFGPEAQGFVNANAGHLLGAMSLYSALVLLLLTDRPARDAPYS